jgi:hypothetical protein
MSSLMFVPIIISPMLLTHPSSGAGTVKSIWSRITKEADNKGKAVGSATNRLVKFLSGIEPF